MSGSLLVRSGVESSKWPRGAELSTNERVVRSRFMQDRCRSIWVGFRAWAGVIGGNFSPCLRLRRRGRGPSTAPPLASRAAGFAQDDRGSGARTNASGPTCAQKNAGTRGWSRQSVGWLPG